jgi:hypothetical protein
VEVNRALRGFGGEIRGSVVDAERHSFLLGKFQVFSLAKSKTHSQINAAGGSGNGDENLSFSLRHRPAGCGTDNSSRPCGLKRVSSSR